MRQVKPYIKTSQNMLDFIRNFCQGSVNFYAIVNYDRAKFGIFKYPFMTQFQTCFLEENNKIEKLLANYAKNRNI